MLRNLDWLHDLDVQYDASTFDTDPFEPQPDGVNTIFPFWVPAPGAEKAEVRRQKADPNSDLRSPISEIRPPLDQKSEIRNQKPGLTSDLCSLASGASRPGYVELPYTLPQDFTLFVLLKEQG